MTPRQRVKTALAHEEPDVVPSDESFWEDCLIRFHEEGMPEDVWPADYFGFDFEHMSLDASPRLPERLIEETEDRITYVAKHGYSAIKWRAKSGALHYFDHVSQTSEGWQAIKSRLTVDIDGTARMSRQPYFPPFVTYPTWEGAAEEFRQAHATDRFVLMSCYGPFEATWRHRGYLESCMDFIENADLLSEMVTAYTDLVCATLRRGIDHGIVPNGLWLTEDLGTTQGTLMSPEAFRQILKPCYARIYEAARAAGIARFMHSDGRIHAILDDLIEVGLEALNPIDVHSGMDLVELKRRYGERLTFFGGISARDMHDAAKSDAEIDRKIPVAAKGGGYIFHSDHSVPPTVGLARYREILERVRGLTRRG
ncbi:MAG: hypothetical protein JXQ73_15825 [Phycisphaerae bacterium]|nr:hypothetical protein [Phycisphaerae bacterium]